MGTTLSTLAPNPGATKKRKRVGRGRGSGVGKTCGRGQKGQKSRSGHHGAKLGFEGGQMPLQMRLPKRGFVNPTRKEAFAVNLSTLSAKFESGEVDVDALRSAGIVPKKAKLIKILASGDIDKALTVKAHRFSEKAKQKIEAAGGSVVVVDTKLPPKAASQNS